MSLPYTLTNQVSIDQYRLPLASQQSLSPPNEESLLGSLLVSLVLTPVDPNSTASCPGARSLSMNGRRLLDNQVPTRPSSPDQSRVTSCSYISSSLVGNPPRRHLCICLYEFVPSFRGLLIPPRQMMHISAQSGAIPL